MLTQDSAAYPCNIYVRMKLRGELHRDHFTEAVRAMFASNPLLGATLETRWGRSGWLIQEVAQRVIHWRTDSLDSQNVPEESQFDLHCEAGLRIDVVSPGECADRHPNGNVTLVAFKLHHAVADGLGIIAAIHDLWIAYDALVKGRPVGLTERNAGTLAARNRFVPNFTKLLQLVPRQVVGLSGVRQFLMRQPASIVTHLPPNDKELAPLSFNSVGYHCSVEETDSLRREAKRRSISLNELLAACVFRGSGQFRAERREQSDRDWLRMMVPVSLRSTSQLQQMSACNVVSSVFLDRQPAQISAFDALAQSVHEEMELIKNNRLALMFILSIWIRKLTAFRSKRTPASRCQTSVVFSNLGKIYVKSPLRDENQRLAPGNSILESFEIYAPLTRFMCAAFTTLIYGQRLALMLRFDPRFIKVEEAQQLLDLVTGHFPCRSPAEALAS